MEMIDVECESKGEIEVVHSARLPRRCPFLIRYKIWEENKR